MNWGFRWPNVLNKSKSPRKGVKVEVWEFAEYSGYCDSRIRGQTLLLVHCSKISIRAHSCLPDDHWHGTPTSQADPPADGVAWQGSFGIIKLNYYYHISLNVVVLG